MQLHCASRCSENHDNQQKWKQCKLTHSYLLFLCCSWKPCYVLCNYDVLMLESMSLWFCVRVIYHLHISKEGTPVYTPPLTYIVNKKNHKKSKWIFWITRQLFPIIIPPLPKGGGGYTVLPLSVCPSVLPSVRPRYFSSHFSH